MYRPVEGELQRAAVEGPSVSCQQWSVRRVEPRGKRGTDSAACLDDMVGGVVCGMGSCVRHSLGVSRPFDGRA
jgi:hypothetical protein